MGVWARLSLDDGAGMMWGVGVEVCIDRFRAPFSF